jgi:hypothetical protein
LALTASAAGRQNMRRNRGRIYLTVGCNMSCGIYAHGHLSLTRRRRPFARLVWPRGMEAPRPSQ